MDRRDVLVRTAALGTAAWIAPSVLTLDRVAAATGSCVAETPTVSNGAVLISPPATNVEGTAPLDSNSNTFVWLEQDGCILDNDLMVNRVTAGTFGGTSDENATIPAGTQFASFFIHGDRLDDSGILTGSLMFASSQIIGLIYRTADLNATSFLQAPGTTYAYGGMEGNDDMGLDLTPGANQLRWSMRFGPHLDQIRVIVSCD